MRLWFVTPTCALCLIANSYEYFGGPPGVISPNFDFGPAGRHARFKNFLPFDRRYLDRAARRLKIPGKFRISDFYRARPEGDVGWTVLFGETNDDNAR